MFSSQGRETCSRWWTSCFLSWPTHSIKIQRGDTRYPKRIDSYLQFFNSMFLVSFLLIWKTPGPRATGGRKGLFQLILPPGSEARMGTQGMNWSWNHGVMLPTGISQAHAQLVTLLTGPRPTCPGMPLPSRLGSPDSIKNMLCRHTHRPIQLEQFFNWGSICPVSKYFSTYSKYCKVCHAGNKTTQDSY